LGECNGKIFSVEKPTLGLSVRGKDGWAPEKVLINFWQRYGKKFLSDFHATNENNSYEN